MSRSLLSWDERVLAAMARAKLLPLERAYASLTARSLYTPTHHDKH